MSILTFAKKYISRDKQPAARPSGRPEKKAMPSKASVASVSLDPSNIDLLPRVTEKSVALQERGYATFRVASRANKHQIAQAVEMKYGVKVLGVRTVPVSARLRQRGNTIGKTSAWKKAYVKVNDVQKISVGP